MDAPEGFWNALGITDDNRCMFSPVRDVILGKDLKCPIDKQRQETVD
jgi:hypothetical protein